MNTDDKSQEEKMSEARIAEILQRVGPRGRPSDAIAAEVKANVRAVWQQEVAAAANRNKSRWRMSIAASVAVLAGVGYFFNAPAPRAIEVAQTYQVIGTLEYRDAGSSDWNPMVTNTPIREATEIRASQDSYAALTLDNGMNLRVDESTQFTISAPGEVFLSRGALYAESDDDSSLLIKTPFGQAQDIGTEFEVRVQPSSWHVQVREGLVAVSTATSNDIAKAGEKIVHAQDQSLQRHVVSSSDHSWQWTHKVHEPFSLEGASLAEYLNWRSDETGHTVRFANDEDTSVASTTILHGSIGDVSVTDSLGVVLSTTRFEIVDSTADQVILGR